MSADGPGVRVEYMVQALLVGRDEPESEASWHDWGHPRTSDEIDGELFQRRLQFLQDKKELAHSDRPQAPTRVLDYRVMRRTVTKSPWVEVTR